MVNTKKFSITVIIFLFIVYVCILFNTLFSPVKPYETTYLKKQVFKVNESVAWHAPHFELDKGATRDNHTQLFEKVESSVELSIDESRDYRKLYQNILLKNQFKFSLYDRDITILNDHNMGRVNNIGGRGIKGEHDHHDSSTRENINNILGNLEKIQASNYPFYSPYRVLIAIGIHKDTMDLILHIGTIPHTVSTIDNQKMSNSPIEKLAEDMLAHYKKAQFTPVNSVEYWQAIEDGMESYTQLILSIQAIIVTNLSETELKTAGLWGGWQSLSPSPREGYQKRR